MVIEQKAYIRCKRCEATYVASNHLPDRQSEYSHYLSHENNIFDPRYRQFLSKLTKPLLSRLHANSSGLDFGCGPGPALAHMMTEAGHKMELFDPFFSPKRIPPPKPRLSKGNITPRPDNPLNATYDFITCTEAVEHFHFPAKEYARLESLLRPGGWLAIMTSFQDDDTSFANWHYRKDPTHVVFYKEATFKCLAVDLNCTCEIITRNIVLMRKQVS